MDEADHGHALHQHATLTFLFTDIEGSTKRWQEDRVGMSAALAEHDQVLATAIEQHGGTVFKHTGDGMCSVFDGATEAVAAALDAQERLDLPVRMGLHTGEAEHRGDDWFGPTLNRAARVMDAGHGGQVLVSSTTAALLGDEELVDLGEYHLKGLDRPERIHQVGSRAFPALRAEPVAKGNLPVPATSFVGRAREVADACAALQTDRLVTLIGVGGSGKTRVALEVARQVQDRFPDGCWFVELGPVNLPDAVPLAVAASLGMAPRATAAIDEVVARWRSRRALLVVDNCEHVLADAGDAVERLLDHCPALAVLATSREPLMLAGERLVPIGSLVPDEAEELFVQRAEAEAPGLELDGVQRGAVTELCRRLDGLPLALELAASRSRAFTPVEMVGELEERFRLLVGGRRGRLERHQTMRGALDWSYDLCSPVEQAVFDALSVFQAPFDIDGGAAVATSGTLGPLQAREAVVQLVDRSLLQRLTAFDGTSRFRMLETMRAYGREHLQRAGLADVVRARHAAYVATFAGSLSLLQLGPEERWVQARMDELLPDALVAMEWFIEHRDWEMAFKAAQVRCGFSDDPDSSTMITRLVDAILASGEHPDVLDDAYSVDPNRWDEDTIPTFRARCWAAVRSNRPARTDRASWPPETLLANLRLTRAETVELFEARARHRDAPAVTRFAVTWTLVRCAARNGFLDLVDEPLAELDEVARSTGSETASFFCAMARGSVQRARGQWSLAAASFGEALAMRPSERSSAFVALCAFHHLALRALAGQASSLEGTDFRDPWISIRDHGLVGLQNHAATSTAIALDRLGRSDLAARLLRWHAVSAGPEFRGMFESTLAAAGLELPEVDSAEPLFDIVDDVLALADDLDAAPATG